MAKRIYNVVLQSAIGDGTTTSNETFFMTGHKYLMFLIMLVLHLRLQLSH